MEDTELTSFQIFFIYIILLVNIGLSITAFVKQNEDLPDIISNQTCDNNAYDLFEAYRLVFPIFYLVFPIVGFCNLCNKEFSNTQNCTDCIILLISIGFLIFNAMTIAAINEDVCQNPTTKPIQLLEKHSEFYFFIFIWPWVFMCVFAPLLLILMDREREVSRV